MQEMIIDICVAIMTPALGYIVWLLKNQKKDRDANSHGTMLLLRVQLIEYHTKYMREGEIPSYAYENFVEMYDAYHALGGNGMVTKIFQSTLPRGERLYVGKIDAYLGEKCGRGWQKYLNAH